MAQPFFKGNYGSALARVDTRPIIEAGRAQGAMFQNMGNQISGAIQQYGLNKQERAKLTGEIEQDIMQYGDRLTMSGNEESDKKNFSAVEKFRRGDSSMADLRGLSGQIARMKLNDAEQQRTQANELMNEMRRLMVEKRKAVQPGEISGTIAEQITAEGLRPLRDSLAGEKLNQQFGALLADPLSEQAYRSKLLDETRLEGAKGQLSDANTQREIFAGMGGVEGAVEQAINKQTVADEINKLSLQKAQLDLLAAQNPNFNPEIRKDLLEVQSSIERLNKTSVKSPLGEVMTLAEYEAAAADDEGLYPLGKIDGKETTVSRAIAARDSEQKRLFDIQGKLRAQFVVPDDEGDSIEEIGSVTNRALVDQALQDFAPGGDAVEGLEEMFDSLGKFTFDETNARKFQQGLQVADRLEPDAAITYLAQLKKQLLESEKSAKQVMTGRAEQAVDPGFFDRRVQDFATGVEITRGMGGRTNNEDLPDLRRFVGASTPEDVQRMEQSQATAYRQAMGYIDQKIAEIEKKK